ncbi:MAG: helix-turn-helix domain-containing protein [Ruminococcus sp.]|nr:helix-turn-helix domain-containing protein [Ruminococcus sp.]MBQ8794829.1 helix-turn-helix domain-containing protein [Clostridia bacterium]
MQNDIKLYTVKEVAELLSISKDRVYILIHSNRLPALNIGGLKVRHEALADFLKETEGQVIDFNNPQNHYVLSA